MLRLVQDLSPRSRDRHTGVQLLKGENRRERVISPEEEKIYLEAAPMLRNIATIILDCGFPAGRDLQPEWSFIRNGNIQNYIGQDGASRPIRLRD
jgi:hypothetical protein